MGNRIYDITKGLQKQTILLECNFAVGATGSVGALLGLGVTNVVRNNTGDYTVTLDDNYPRLLGFNVQFSGTSTSGIMNVMCNDATPQTSIVAGTFSFKCYNASGSAADPTNGSVCYINLLLRRSSVGQAGE